PARGRSRAAGSSARDSRSTPGPSGRFLASDQRGADDLLHLGDARLPSFAPHLRGPHLARTGPRRDGGSDLAHHAIGVLADAAHAETLDFRNGDRKSTRLNSSHLVISYAVFC